MNNSELEDLEKKALLGELVRSALSGDIGRALAAESNADKDEATDELLKIDPYGFVELSALQAKISSIQERYKIALKVGAYFNSFIINGETALALLEQMENNDEG